jgi:transcriptional regulator with XRE-family HTH domain
LNESLCRALLRAGLSEEDVAARLGVDPKTARRWMEGRALPYLRHRWALAAMLGVDEGDLWPQLRAVRSRPDEVKAVYPRLDAVPREVWLGLFVTAEREVGILDQSALLLTGDSAILGVLCDRAAAGVKVRICLAGPDEPHAPADAVRNEGGGTLAADVQRSIAGCTPLRRGGNVEIRLHRGAVFNSIYRGDDQLLARQYVYGVPARQCPALLLHRTGPGDMTGAYLESLERIWANARPLEEPSWLVGGLGREQQPGSA